MSKTNHRSFHGTHPSIVKSAFNIMSTLLSPPKVLLVGRTNVGKSTLFNRLTQQKLSIVFEREGVTRDYLQELISWDSKTFALIDTGGFSFAKNQDDIGKRVQEKVVELLSYASLILFVCDGKNGLTQEDIKIAQILRRSNKPVFLLINKADNMHGMEEHMPEFYKLGFETVIPVSGIHGIGIATLLNGIVEAIPLPVEHEEKAPSYNVALIGRPNVGKSSLMNLLIEHERSIVSPIAGTTREAISDTTYYCNDLIQVTDTAGVRRSRNVDDDLEQLMVKSSLQAVREANLVLIMVDASEGKIADQELKLLFYAYEQQKMVVVIFNKIDLLNEYTNSTLEQSIAEYEFILKKIPQIWISCLTHRNVGKIFAEIQNVWQRCNQKFNPVEVDEIVKNGLASMHLYHTGQELKLKKIRPLEGRIPTFLLKVNHPEWFGPSQLSCIENILRKHYDLKGCPIHLVTAGDK